MAAEPICASVLIDAEPSEVYEYFVDAEAMVQWMGERARLDPRPGGEFSVDVEGTAVRGRFLELDPPHRIVFSWGFDGTAALPPGASRVEVRLTREATGTRVDLVHSGLSEEYATRHVRGWRHFLDRLEAKAAS